jgi:hypothetical protein
MSGQGAAHAPAEVVQLVLRNVDREAADGAVFGAPAGPNVPAMISIARGNELTTMQTHAKPFSPDVNVSFPEPAIEYARAALVVMSTKRTPPSAALEAVAAAPQPPCPASCNALLIAAAKQSRSRTARPKGIVANRIRVRSPS